MTSTELIRKLKELDELVLTHELDDYNDLTDYALEQCHYCLEDAIDHLKEGE